MADKNAEQLLVRYYLRNGVLRMPNQERRKKDKTRYHKGYEIRLIAHSEQESAEIRRLLRAAGFKVARSFKKINRIARPVYGKKAVERFLDLVKASGEASS